tara:strand:+ start:6538 stop:6834 length:297 start_codon:yes stop_codon:yes gene_type:complete
MKKAGMSYMMGGSKSKKMGKGGKMKYNMGGASMVNKMTSGDGDSFVRPMNEKRNMIDYFAQTGLEMVDDTMEYSMMKKGGSTKKGGVRKTARKAYMKK